MIIREYKKSDETSWVRCRLISFLDTSFFDDIRREKECYKNPSLCIVAEDNGTIVGFLDIEYELTTGDTCYLKGERGAVIWNLGVMPEYQNLSVASKMWSYAKDKLIPMGIKRFEVWTQDDEKANNWYKKHNFIFKESYINAFLDTDISKNELNRYVNLQSLNATNVRNLNFEAPIEMKKDLEKICERIHEVRIYEYKN